MQEGGEVPCRKGQRFEDPAYRALRLRLRAGLNIMQISGGELMRRRRKRESRQPQGASNTCVAQDDSEQYDRRTPVIGGVS